MTALAAPEAPDVGGVTELTCLTDLAQSHTFSWRVVNREPGDAEPEDAEPAHAESARAAWLHDMYTALQQDISIRTARAWEILEEIRNLPDPPLPAGSPLPASAAPDAHELAECELMARNKVSQGQADHRLHEAGAVTGLSKVLGLTKAGQLGEDKARAIARHIGRLLPLTGDAVADAERRRAVEDAIIDRACERTTRQLAYDVRRAVNEVDPDALRKDHEREKTKTHVRCGTDHAGMGLVEARLDDEAVATINTVLDLMANAARNAAHRAGLSLDEVGATHQNRRANALAGIFTAILDGSALHTAEAEGTEDGHTVPAWWEGAWWEPPTLPTRKRRAPHLVLTVNALTLLGLDNLAGTLAGYDAISPDLARKIAKACRSVEVVFTDNPDAGAHVVGTEVLHTDAYTPTGAIHARIGALYPFCMFPGCDRPAHDCDSDHADPFVQGGQTRSDRIVPGCRRHHKIRTHTDWDYELRPDGSVLWTSPTGQHFLVRPDWTRGQRRSVTGDPRRG